MGGWTWCWMGAPATVPGQPPSISPSPRGALSKRARFRKKRSRTVCSPGNDWMRYVLIAVGGAAGSLARYLAGTAIMTRFGSRFPMGTMVVNVTGCFLIGLLTTLFTERFSPGPNWRPLLIIGFLGGYTTFSSFEWETFQAFRGGRSEEHTSE